MVKKENKTRRKTKGSASGKKLNHLKFSVILYYTHSPFLHASHHTAGIHTYGCNLGNTSHQNTVGFPLKDTIEL